MSQNYPLEVRVNENLYGLLYINGVIEYTHVINTTRRDNHICTISDEVNTFPYSYKDLIILKARKLVGGE